MAIWRIAFTWGKDELAAQQLKASILPEPTAVGEVNCHFSPMHRLLCLLEQSTRCFGDHARIRLLSTLFIMEDASYFMLRYLGDLGSQILAACREGTSCPWGSSGQIELIRDDPWRDAKAGEMHRALFRFPQSHKKKSEESRPA